MPSISKVPVPCPALAVQHDGGRDGRVAAVYTGEISQDDLRRVLDRMLEEDA